MEAKRLQLKVKTVSTLEITGPKSALNFAREHMQKCGYKETRHSIFAVHLDKDFSIAGEKVIEETASTCIAP